MSRTNKTIANIYNPLNQDKQSLLDNFVIRQKEFDTIFRDLKTSKLNQTSQNFLIQGLRGSGKTTLLAKLRYEIEDSKNLSHLLVIQFTEEQYNIFSLNRLWQEVADNLEEKKGFEKIVEEMDKYEDDDDFYSLLAKYLKKNRKKLVLLIDNFGDILDKLKEIEHKKLRDILHESDLQIIAASTRTLETAYKHDKPFFESFKTLYLDALTEMDVQNLLENLSSQHDNHKALKIIKKQKGRIEVIRRLTGGIPRTIILLYEIILDDSASVFEDLEGILDKITPLYKHKMDDLATQQQVIVDAIALNWDGMLTSEISQKTKLDTKTISAQLKILEKSGFIISKLINKKDKLYMINERFFNIWYLMRCGRKKGKQQVLWLVSFLKEWCTEDELIKKARNHITLAKAGALNPRGAYYMAEALSQSIPDTELQYEVLTSTKKHIYQTNPHVAESLPDTDEMVPQLATKAYKNKEFKKAEKYCLIAVKNGDVDAMFNLALLYQAEYKDFKKAEKYYLTAVENKHVKAMCNVAFLYEIEYKDFKKAEKYYLMAVKNKDVKAMCNLAFLYETEYEEFKKAEKYYLMAAKNKHVVSMYNLALLYETENKEFKKAEKYYLMAVENDFKNHMGFLIERLFAKNETGVAVLSITEKYYTKTNYVSLFALSIILVHAEKYKESTEYFNLFLDLTEEVDNLQKHITNFFMLLISRKQYQLAFKLFQEEKYHLKEKIKPVYFALMNLMQNEYPKEYKRMGAEISGTVNEILERIKALEK
ncbi:MAG: AAA family ATPase [Candidatus Anammoxibacter sp.]